MPIEVDVKNPIIYEQILSYKNCKNLIRSSMVHTNNLRRNIYCTFRNAGKTAQKIVAWLSVTTLETKDRYDELPKVYCSKNKEKLLKSGEETTEAFRLETPRMSGIFELRLNAKMAESDDSTAVSIVVPSLKRIMGDQGIEFHEMKCFQVYSHRSGIQHNNQNSLFLFQTRKPFDVLPKLPITKKRTIATISDDTKPTPGKVVSSSDSDSDSDSDFDLRRKPSKKHKAAHAILSLRKRKNTFDVSSDDGKSSDHLRIKEPANSSKKTRLEPILSVQELYELDHRQNDSAESTDSKQDLDSEVIDAVLKEIL